MWLMMCSVSGRNSQVQHMLQFVGFPAACLGAGIGAVTPCRSSSPSTEELIVYAHLTWLKFVLKQFTIPSRQSRYGQEEALMCHLESSMSKNSQKLDARKEITVTYVH